MAVAEGRVDGRQSRWDEHKRLRRQAIIEAALEVLQNEGSSGDISVQQVAHQAGLHRTVLHRHFKDRADLDLAVQREISERAADVFLGAVQLDATAREIVHNVVDAFVRWAVEHPSWVRFAMSSIPGVAERPMDDVMSEVVEQIEMVIAGVAEVVGGEMGEDDRDLLEPWVASLIGGGLSAVMRWTGRGELRPRIEVFVEFITDISFAQILAVAEKRGLPIPEGSVQEMVDRIIAGNG